MKDGLDKILTIVVPVYNVEKYICKCLDSLVLDDPELMSLLEVIIVNDGTPDRAAELSREYVKRYPETFRQIDKENGNYGSCINRGLAEARGKFIKILDADDWFDKAQFTEFLLQLGQLSEEVDLVLTDYEDVDVNGVPKKYQKFDIVHSTVSDFQQLEDVEAVFFIHALTYRTDFLRSIGYRQTEGVSYSDCEWSYIPMAHINKFIYLPIDIYRYRVGRDGQTMDSRVLTKTVRDHVTVSKSIVSYYDNLSEEFFHDNTRLRVDNAIKSIGKNIYKICLVEQSHEEFSVEVLKDYDDFLMGRRPSVYEALEGLTLNGVPFHYVRFWHRFGFRFPLGLIRDVVRKIRYR